MRLFATGHLRPGLQQDVVVEVEGVKVNLTLAARVTAEKRRLRIERHLADERRANFAAVSVPEGRDARDDGSLDWLEQGRV